MPIFCGTPLGRQSPYSVYKFPSAAQVGIHESQPWVEAICFISDLASQLIGPTTAVVVASSNSGVSSIVPLQAPELPARIQSRRGSAGPRKENNDFGIDLPTNGKAGGATMYRSLSQNQPPKKQANRRCDLLDSARGGPYPSLGVGPRAAALVPASVSHEVSLRQREIIGSLFLAALALGCQPTEPTAPPPPPVRDVAPTGTGFHWVSATPESQGMCGSIKVLSCTKTLAYIWNNIQPLKYQTKRLLIIRNDKIIYDRGGTLPYHVYSASKGLLGAPTLVHAMSKCGVGLTDPASRWLSRGDGARWGTDDPWTAITVEQLASHTSGVCDYANTSAVCHDE